VTPNRLRAILIGLIAAAAVVSVVAQKADNRWLGWVSFALFTVAVGVYFRWRQAVRAKVFDRQAKTPR
jgi:hypothetical protein